MKKYWESYKEIATQVASELPMEVAPFGEFVIKWSPFIFFLLVVAKLIDKLFESASIKFLANGFVSLCKLTWAEAFKEPAHKGIIIEAPISVQRVFHKCCSWVQGVQAFFLLLFTFLALYPLLTMQIRADKLIEGVIVLSFLSGAGIFLAFVQVGLCHQSIKLAKSLKNN